MRKLADELINFDDDILKHASVIIFLSKAEQPYLVSISNRVWMHTHCQLNFVKMFDCAKTRMIGLPYGEKTMTIR